MRVRVASALASCLFLLATLPVGGQAGPSAKELRFCLHGEPKTFNPVLVDDEASEHVRYLTGGVLIRLNRQTQALEPGLADSWKISKDGRTITFHLRKGLAFSDGTPFSAEDVAYTMRQLMDPQMHSPTGDAFRSGEGTVAVQTPAADVAVITFPAPVAGLERLGARVRQEHGYIEAEASHGLEGAAVQFDRITVTGTEDLLMAAVLVVRPSGLFGRQS
jgi:peptide/nickel transport system substrate-binding protein